MKSTKVQTLGGKLASYYYYYYYYSTLQHRRSEERMMKGDDMRVCVDGLKALAASSQKTIHTHNKQSNDNDLYTKMHMDR